MMRELKGVVSQLAEQDFQQKKTPQCPKIPMKELTSSSEPIMGYGQQTTTHDDSITITILHPTALLPTGASSPTPSTLQRNTGGISSRSTYHVEFQFFRVTPRTRSQAVQS